MALINIQPEIEAILSNPEFEAVKVFSRFALAGLIIVFIIVLVFGLVTSAIGVYNSNSDMESTNRLTSSIKKPVLAILVIVLGLFLISLTTSLGLGIDIPKTVSLIFN